MNIVEKLKEEIKVLETRIDDIQDNCSHPDVEREAGSNTGNWCPHDDSYWYNCTCNLCFKYWTETP